MKNFFSKFKFLIWSWEFDILKIFPYLFLFISFLPILPYEKKEGKLISVLGKEASVENFYELGIKNLDSIFGLYITEKKVISQMRVRLSTNYISLENSL